jgi:hypothetical protein
MPNSAAVGVREDGDDNVTAAGEFSRVANPPVQAGSTVLNTYGADDLNAAQSMQGDLAFNPFQEVNLMVGEFAKKMGVGPRAAWERIQQVGTELFRQSFS